MSNKPPMKSSNEAKPEQLKMAKEQGQAYKKALMYMAKEEADDGGEKRAGDFIVAYAIEKAEGMYHKKNGSLEWKKPKSENCHIEISVRDGADERFIPGLDVKVTVIDQEGNEVGTHKQEFLWHPWLYHYGRNWKVPASGTYTLRVQIQPPKFMRHDEKNGLRYQEPVEVVFDKVKIQTGQK